MTAAVNWERSVVHHEVQEKKGRKIPPWVMALARIVLGLVDGNDVEHFLVRYISDNNRKVEVIVALWTAKT